ncbi:AAA family ATPase [Paraburkholderia terricola]|uniref:Prefoldin subunit 5 n=1 Tax=Paraburkholderia terricola TaxID=169427 RepID=A0ABU1M055_9BURK|nr:AAA family ATPase [Paraburkholderia terricola]MDR6412371.1 prefoldin subunit 5 [Paraburkholderia terricola]MDR6481179.1 prefoldin subunit 5 [Paraburkholderia terricola]
MTLLEPTLQVNRLVVFQGGHVAFDCAFHAGVNVIRGRNSSGKTTVMDLLAFSLGAENIRWKPEALRCTATYVEVRLNGAVACLRREIDIALQRPMSIFWGTLDESLKAGPQLWELYPFKRSAHRISFSQALFDALNMPQAQGEGASNLTMHQLLRVLYADQPSVHSPIFRLDNFDSPLTREMVGGYLGGVYDDLLYAAQLRLRELEAQISKQETELRSIFNVLGRSEQSTNLEFLDTKIVELEAARNALTASLARLKQERTLPRKDANKARASADDLRQKLNIARQQESASKDKLAALDLDIADSRLFVKELESRLRSLDESKETRSYFGNMQFRFCPSCLCELPEARADAAHCHLCTTPLGDGRGDTQLLRMRNELSIQLKESTSLIENRVEEAEALRVDIPLLSQRVRALERDYAAVAKSWSSDVEVAVEEAARKLGALDAEIRQSYEQQKLASVITDLQKRRDSLTAESKRLEESIVRLEQKQAQRKVEVASAIDAAMVRLLKLDLPLQPEFVKAETANFDFVHNAVYVNNSRNFSESSAVVLRHIFHLALLTASVQKPFMRVPRFIMLDGIDDGGMEKERSHRLQEIIVEECATYEVGYQVIFATSDINPALEETNLVVGRFFTPEARSLDVRDA